MRIETSRLIVRSFEESDVDAYAAIVADPFVTRFLSDGIPHTSLDARHYVYDCIRCDHDTGISRYAVIRKTESDFIGFSGFKEYDDWIDFGWRFALGCGDMDMVVRLLWQSSDMEQRCWAFKGFGFVRQ